MGYCKRCGQEVDDHDLFCPHCGHYNFSIGNNNGAMEVSKDQSGMPPKNEYHMPNYSMILKPSSSRAQDGEPSVVPYTNESQSKKNDAVKIPERDSEKARPVKTDAASSNDEAAATEAEFEYHTRLEEKKGSGLKSFFMGLLIFLLLIGAGVFAAYYAYNYFMGDSAGEYENSIAKLSNKIDKANQDMVSVLKKNTETLPVDDIIKQVALERDEFNNIETSLDSVIVPSSYASSNKSLRNGIMLNKEIYQLLGQILSTPADLNAMSNVNSLSDQLEQCVKAYSSVKVKNVNITLPSEIASLTTRVSPWVKQKQAEYSQVTSLIASYSKYFDDMSKIFAEYDSATADFNQMLKDIRNKQASWDYLFSQIDKSEKIKLQVKTDYGKITVPQYLRTINKDFKPVLDDSTTYTIKLRAAAQAEKNFNKALYTQEQAAVREKEIEDMYQDAEKYNSSSSTGYQKFLTDMSSEKERCMNPEYVLKIKSGK